jgi:hypothetical protein
MFWDVFPAGTSTVVGKRDTVRSHSSAKRLSASTNVDQCRRTTLSIDERHVKSACNETVFGLTQSPIVCCITKKPEQRERRPGLFRQG